MKKAYFEYPFRGPIYGVELDMGEGESGIKIVKLPEGQCVELTIDPKYYTKALEAAFREGLPEAKCIVPLGQATQEFKGDWAPLIEMIAASAESNALFGVILTPEEYKRLRKEGLDGLYSQLPDSASGLLYLYKNGPHGTSGPTLELYRTCGCVH